MAMAMAFMVKNHHTDIMLKIKQLVFTLSITLALFSCNVSKHVELTPRAQADAYYSKGEYTNALLAYQQIDTLSRDSIVWHNIASAALHTKDFATATNAAQHIKIDTELKNGFNQFADSIQNYQSQAFVIENNISFFQSIYPKNIFDILSVYYSQRSDNKLIGVYNQASTQVRSQCFEKYFSFVKNEKNEKELTQICQNALSDNANQITALKYLGVQTYNAAEADYKKAMDEYNRNKNNTTYAYLRRDLKRISAVYVKSRDYLDKVHALQPDDVPTIKYLININNRLDQPAKAKALQRLLK